MNRNAIVFLPVVLALCAPATLAAQEGDPFTLKVINDANSVLKAQWMDLRVEQVEVLSLSQGRAAARLHLQPYRWVANDARRAADGAHLTYLFDRERGVPAGAAVTPGQAEAAVDRAMSTWGMAPCLSRVGFAKRPFTGADVTVFDAQLGYGGSGDWRAADVVIGGWMPPAFFDAVVPDGGRAVLALSVTFIFVGPDGQPTDLDRDGNMDTAASEIYFNDGFSWAVNGGPGFDIQTVALHELGHSLGLGHLGPPPTAVMNPVYAGPRPSLRPLDQVALCGVWASWPH
jgi:hypothetical protein